MTSFIPRNDRIIIDGAIVLDKEFLRNLEI